MRRGIGVLLAVVGGLVVMGSSLVAGRAATSSTRFGRTSTVPLRVQRILKKHAPKAAYLPSRLPAGYAYDHYENLSGLGFDLYFGCCGDHVHLIGFDALIVRRGEPCGQGPPMKVFRIGGTVVDWSSLNRSEMAWRCLRHGETRRLFTVSAGPPHTPRQLAEVVASIRPIR
jgi:hypothetical protein